MKYLKEFTGFDDWDYDEEYPINYGDGNIHPNTFVKYRYAEKIFYIIGDFINNKTHIYTDKIGEVSKDFLYDIKSFINIEKEELINILDGVIMDNGFEDWNKKTYTFNDIYPSLSKNYKNYLNEEFDNILLKCGYE